VTDSRVALVTGANRGIGAAIAARLAADGFTVVGTHRGSGVAEGIHGVECDVTDPDSVDAAFKFAEENFGPVSVVVANSGITKDTLVMRMKDEQFLDVVNTNLAGAFRVAKRATRNMLKQKYGRIIFIGSTSGLSGVPGQVNYTASKAGVIGMARSFARELGVKGVTANVIAPGFTETDMTEAMEDKAKEIGKSMIPLGRFAQPEEIAAAVAFIASEQSSYITGTVLNVDGGVGMGH
jgi:beta-ketoacyl ACP reductase